MFAHGKGHVRESTSKVDGEGSELHLLLLGRSMFCSGSKCAEAPIYISFQTWSCLVLPRMPRLAQNALTLPESGQTPLRHSQQAKSVQGVTDFVAHVGELNWYHDHMIAL